MAIHRKIESTILEMLRYFRIVALYGPRQSGKTTLQKKIAHALGMKYYTFDDLETRNTATDDTSGFITYITRKGDVAIDEVQMIPSVIPALKIAVFPPIRGTSTSLPGWKINFFNSLICF